MNPGDSRNAEAQVRTKKSSAGITPTEDYNTKTKLLIKLSPMSHDIESLSCQSYGFYGSLAKDIYEPCVFLD